MDHSLARCIRSVLLAAAFVVPATLAQAGTGETPSPEEQGGPTSDAAGAREPQQVPDIAMIGEITVVGRREQNIQQATTEVLSVLSSKDIARMGEGDIAGALGRITGISVVGGASCTCGASATATPRRC